MAVPTQDGGTELRLFTHPAVRPDDRTAHGGALLDLRLAADDRVGGNPRAGLDQRAFVDEARSFDRGAVLDARFGGDPGTRLRQVAERRRLVATGHDVAVHVDVLLRRADV